jgi:hypothetical protein
MRWPSPITAYVGVNGSGKTLSAVAIAVIDQRRRGRPIISNVGGLAAEHYHVESVEQLPDLMGQVGSCTVVLDEAGAMFSSRDGSKEKKAFQMAVQQLRKYDCRLLWTAPAFARADKILREVTFEVVLCRSLIKRHERGKVWPSTRLIHQKSFDVSRLDSSGMTINRNARGRASFGVVRTARWEKVFDSFATTGIEHAPVDDAPVVLGGGLHSA